MSPTTAPHTRRTVRRRLRLVAVRLPDSAENRYYLTNIDPDSLDAQAVAQTYAARWQIELIFKELKSHYRLDDRPLAKRISSRPCYSVRSSRCWSVAGCSRPYVND